MPEGFHVDSWMERQTSVNRCLPYGGSSAGPVWVPRGLYPPPARGPWRRPFGHTKSAVPLRYAPAYITSSYPMKGSDETESEVASGPSRGCGRRYRRHPPDRVQFVLLTSPSTAP